MAFKANKLTTAIRYRVWTSASDGSAREEQLGSFDEGQSRVMVAFREYAERLARTEVFARGTEDELSIHIAHNGQISAALPAPPKRAEFIHRLRPFVLAKEPTYFPAVRNLLSEELRLQGVRERLKLIKDRFFGRRLLSAIKLMAADTTLNSDATVDLWLNAFEFHFEDDKRKALQALYGIVPEPACEAIFFAVLQEKGIAVLELAKMIDDIIRAPANAGHRTVA